MTNKARAGPSVEIDFWSLLSPEVHLRLKLVLGTGLAIAMLLAQNFNELYTRLFRTDPELAEQMAQNRQQQHFGAAGKAGRKSANASQGSAACNQSIDPLIASFDNMRLRPQSANNDSLATSDVTLISHLHGRERRMERNIQRRELQEAIKYGRKERANPGRDGSKRWKIVHKGVTFICDATLRHEITSWRMDDEEEEPAVVGMHEGGAAHTVLVVDQSGSMRAADIHGYPSRTAAVYDAVTRDFVEHRIREREAAAAEAAREGRAAPPAELLSLVEFADDATVVFERVPLNRDAAAALRKRAQRRARSHGNYLPALEAVRDVLRGDARGSGQLLVVFLSDGAPSDHNIYPCAHGHYVWSDAGTGAICDSGKHAGKLLLSDCPEGGGVACRLAVKKSVAEGVRDLIRKMGDRLGRDRLYLCTVAFGPASENFEGVRAGDVEQTLQDMATVLPRSSFQKLGLSAHSLRTALSSISSTLSTLQSDAQTSTGLTKRSFTQDKKVTARNERDWDIYCDKQLISKRQWDPRLRGLRPVPLLQGAGGIAHGTTVIGSGVDRIVYHAAEVANDGEHFPDVGPRLVAKEQQHVELMKDNKYAERFCRLQGQAQVMAQAFNRRVRGGAHLQLNFVQCFVYTVRDPRWPGGEAQFLAEHYLEGKFIKFNNNAGAVNPLAVAPQRRKAAPVHFALDEIGAPSALVKIGTDLVVPSALRVRGADAASPARRRASEREGRGADEDKDEWSDGSPVGSSCSSRAAEISADDIPQGVYNEDDGFVLTDPAIHEKVEKGKRSRTNKGARGISLFFETHKCNALCRALGLMPGPKPQ